MNKIQVTWMPIIDNTDASQLIVESGHPFLVAVKSEAGAVQWVVSQHDGLTNFVSVDVPVTAKVEVRS